MNIWTVLTSSSVIAAIVASVTSLLVNRVRYRNEYYKMVIDKRMKAYELVMNTITTFKLSAVGTDAKPYHMVFSNNFKLFNQSLSSFSLAQMNSLWLSKDMTKCLTELNKIIFEISDLVNDDIENNIQIGKQNYWKIATARDSVEACVKKDLLKLHKVSDFLKEKKTTGSNLFNIKINNTMNN